MENKWQRMLTIVNQSSQLHLIHKKQFKKLYINRLLTENLFAFLLQYTGLMISLLSSYTSPLWLASGTASAFIFLRGPSILPGIWLGSMFGYYFHHSSIELAFICSLIYTLQAYAHRQMTYSFIGIPPFVNQPLQIVKYIFLSGLLTAFSSYLLLEMHLFSLPIHRYKLWILWWLANFNSLLIIPFALITWDMFFPQFHFFKKINRLKLIPYVFLFGFIIFLLFCSQLETILILEISIIATIFFVVKSFGTLGGIFSIFLLGMLLALGSFLKVPLFDSSNFLILFSIQLLVLIVSMAVIMMPCRHHF